MTTDILENLTQELNPAQKQAVLNPLNSCTKIVAGAGTGKTKIISKRFNKLVFDLIEEKTENPTSKILVITFTEKAANEMKDRIIKELNANSLNSYGDDLWISTFHGFCSKILRRHAIEANLAPNFELAEEQALYKTYETIIKTLKYDEYKKINNISLIEDELGLNCEILSVEKLKTLMRIDNLDSVFGEIFSIIKKIKSIGLTPKEFLQKTLYATNAFSDTIETLPFDFEETSEYVVNWQNHLRPYIDDFCVFEEDSAFSEIAKKPILTKNRSRKAEDWEQAENFPQIIEPITKIEIYLTKVIAYIYAIYQKELETQNLADFDDLINKTLFIFKNNSVIRAYYQKYFKHIIIDEFQDTNGAQLELIKLLLNETAPNITFVGDRKQSIYGFRHAQTENLEELQNFVEQKYKQKYQPIKLETNYRSTAHVLNAVNFVTEEHLKLDETLSPNLSAPQENENKFVKNTEITNLEYSNDIKTAEAKFIACEIEKLKKENKAKYRDFAILVKSHHQSDLIDEILTEAGIPAIKKTNTSFFTHPTIKNALAVLKLLKKPLDEIALTRILQIDLSDAELYAIKQQIDNDISENNLNPEKKRLKFSEKIIALYQKNLLKSQKLKNIFNILAQSIKTKNQKSILELFTNFEQNINLYSTRNELEQLQNEYNLRVFEKIIYDFERTKTYTNITEFLEYCDKICEDRTFELPVILTSEIDAVQIMTIHASKGLEFPYVFVCGISSKINSDKNNITFDLQYGKRPGFGIIISKLNKSDSPKKLLYRQLWEKPRILNENIRVFYVAVSRAVKYLNILTYTPQTRNKPADYTQNYPNSILFETIDGTKINIPKIEELPFEKPNNSGNKLQILDVKEEKHEQNHHFSFSKLNTYSACPKKFVLKYKFQYPAPEAENLTTQTGSLLHKLICNSFLYKKEFSNEEIKKLLENENTDITRVCELYQSFVGSKYSVSALSGQKTYSERPFEFAYNLHGKEIIFSGDIDLLIENPNKTCTIVDFKTNKNLDKSNSEYQKQLYLYKKALGNEGLTVKEAFLCGLNENGNTEEIKLENEQATKIEFEALTEKAIECFEQNEIPNGSEQYCQTCEYKYLCK